MDNEQNTHEAAACSAEAAASGGEPAPDIILASGSPRRKQLLERLDLPERMSANALLEALNVLMDRTKLERCCAELFAEKREI